MVMVFAGRATGGIYAAQTQCLNQQETPAARL